MWKILLWESIETRGAFEWHYACSWTDNWQHNLSAAIVCSPSSSSLVSRFFFLVLSSPWRKWWELDVIFKIVLKHLEYVLFLTSFPCWIIPIDYFSFSCLLLIFENKTLEYFPQWSQDQELIGDGATTHLCRSTDKLLFLKLLCVSPCEVPFSQFHAMLRFPCSTLQQSFHFVKLSPVHIFSFTGNLWVQIQERCQWQPLSHIKTGNLFLLF